MNKTKLRKPHTMTQGGGKASYFVSKSVKEFETKIEIN
jgi:hypothetical protein